MVLNMIQEKSKKTIFFVALEGANVDGHDYIDSAVKNGANLYYSEQKS